MKKVYIETPIGEIIDKVTPEYSDIKEPLIDIFDQQEEDKLLKN